MKEGAGNLPWEKEAYKKQSHNPLVEKNLDPKSKYGQVQKKETFGSSKNTQLMQQWFKKWMKLSERFSPSLRN